MAFGFFGLSNSTSTLNKPVINYLHYMGYAAESHWSRYFGGTLLGTGGLVRAYTEAAVGAVTAAGVITFTTFARCSIAVNYSDYQKIQSILSDVEFRTEETEYRENVTIIGRVILPKAESFFASLSEQTGGRAVCTSIEGVYDF